MWFSTWTLLDLLVPLALLLVLAKLVIDRRNSHFASLSGPRSNNPIIGRLREVMGVVTDVTAVYDRWISEYGYVFKVPLGILGTNCIVISDPKGVAHVYANDGFRYLRLEQSKKISRAFSGHSMISADKEDHKRQRRAIAPAFTSGVLRESMSIFYDTAYKVKGSWDAMFESCDEVTIDVQQWMNKLTLDSIGIAGFGYDFKSLDGHESSVSEAFDSMLKDNSFPTVVVLGSLFPQIINLPLKQTKILRRMKTTFTDIAKVLVEKSQQEKGALNVDKDKSILGMLLKGQSHDTNFKLVQDEIVGQGLFLFAGYETTAISLSWTLVELARHPEKQDKLRKELLQFSGSDPTWDQIVTGNACPYLDAVVHEVLRLHPPAEALQRMADKDDVVPLSTPMKMSSGEIVDSIFVPKGTMVITPFTYLNRSETFWGPDAKQFVPERWLEENPHPSKDFSGYKHIYTFSDGPRICLGRMFALAEFKAVLTVLIRNFTFDLPSGPDTPIGIHRVILPRPKLANETGCDLRMRVRQVSG